MRRIGVLGGTFDPVHFGHLIAASSVRSEFHLERLIFTPAGIPPHKGDIRMSTPVHRIKMLEIALDTEADFEVSDIEFQRPGPSYTVETAKALRENYGEPSEIFYVIGTDSAVELQSWKDADELLSLLKFVVVSRPGYNKEEILEKYSKRCTFLKIPALDISSSQIRERVKSGLSVKYLLPEKVREYILRNGLYE